MSYDNERPKKKYVKHSTVVVGKSDLKRRSNLLHNAKYRFVRIAEQRGADVFIRVGSEDYEIVDYIILDAKLEKV